jgi:SAM-dependent methyltransferase
LGTVGMTPAGTAEYGLGNAWRDARARLTSIEKWLDPGTTGHLRALGVGPGWRCLEVGGGGGSIAGWLCAQVAPGGDVTATDIDTRFLAALKEPNLRVERHDVTVDPLPSGAFDLVHCRLVLAHLPERQAVLTRLAAAVKPSGWLVAEEMDFASVVAGEHQPGARAFLRAVEVSNDVLRGRGFDPGYGRRLLADVTATGLAGIGTEGRATIWPGGSAGAAAWQLTFEQLLPEMTARGLDQATAAAAIAACRNPGFSFLSQLTIAAWGQRR